MYAIIDIGSNTIRLNVYQVEEDGAIHSIFQSKETAGLAGYVQAVSYTHLTLPTT